ncbi:preprotein translocase subunit SecE [Candidatus Peregrinibacteria bacterium]|jgi:preprotein translocase subunit SecE|nr:preprotein translocase subunit SecE [Candidatus Peregrinibacteria bacterium]MBT4148564.1 preprotein translocase subunit SecE [Candidatus Peregrinibacteria bacterium]MBT4455991.1 preprotein translocase subunit SecE [Candidatus Peregrinibacteria bacterium]
MKDVKEIAKDNKLTNYVKDSLKELTKVTWPTKNQAVRLTIIVLGFVFVFAIFLAGTDFLANKGYAELLEWAAKLSAPTS